MLSLISLHPGSFDIHAQTELKLDRLNQTKPGDRSEIQLETIKLQTKNDNFFNRTRLLYYLEILRTVDKQKLNFYWSWILICNEEQSWTWQMLYFRGNFNSMDKQTET